MKYFTKESLITMDQLYSWLAKIEQSQYYDLFMENGVTFEVLGSVDLGTLKEIGVSKVGDRIQIAVAVNELKNRTLIPPGGNGIQVIVPDGTMVTLDLSNYYDAGSIKKQILNTVHLPLPIQVFLQEKGQVHPLSDTELVSLCFSTDSHSSVSKTRIIVTPQGLPPSAQALQASSRLTHSLSKPVQRNSKEPLASDTSSQIKQFFGQRPPSELISHNLLEYFPDTKPRQLQQTLRNSVRLSQFSSNSRLSSVGSILLHDTASVSSKRMSIVSTLDNHRVSTIDLLDDEDDEDEDEEDFMDLLSLQEADGPTNWLKGARIGAGSFGTVYLGMNSFTGELMAVKQVEVPKDKTDTLIFDALKQEMNLLKNLHHENIVSYIGASTDQQFFNIFIEYVPGGSVATMLNNYGPFEEPLVRNFIRQILQGLKYLHDEQIIHRDIKGANVLIDIKGTVKISDFGISKKFSSSDSQSQLNKRSSLQGSVYWMAPEVVKQTAYTTKLDIWSVGCLVIEMLTGKHPFPDLSQMQLIFKIGTHTKPIIPAWATEDLKLFLQQAFELDYLKRPGLDVLLSHDFLNSLIVSKS